MTKLHKAQRDRYESYYRNSKLSCLDIPDYKISGQLVLKRKKILILGSGEARDTKYLMKNNYLTAVDFSETAVKYLKGIGIQAYQLDLDDSLPFDNNSYDIVVAKDILEHLKDPLNLGKEIHRVLKPNGYAVINVPNHFYLPMRLRILFGKNLIWRSLLHNHTKDFKEWNYMHKTYFTWKGFQEYIEDCGFKIVKKYWDLGTLNHYEQPEMAIDYLRKTGRIRNIYLKVFEVSWQIVNLILPRILRSKMVELSPGLFSASFYVWVSPRK